MKHLRPSHKATLCPLDSVSRSILQREALYLVCCTDLLATLCTCIRLIILRPE